MPPTGAAAVAAAVILLALKPLPAFATAYSAPPLADDRFQMLANPVSG